MRKLYYYVELENISPMNIGNGSSNDTDMDVITDEKGCFFIPGTSLAGVCLSVMNDEEKILFNPELSRHGEKVEYKKSALFFSDAYMKENTVIEMRDGIKLDKNKITIDGAKFDYQIIPAGYHFILRIEVNDYEENEKYESLVLKIFEEIQNHDIQVGCKTSRGLGVLKINQCKFKQFTKENFEELYEFDPLNPDLYEELTISNKDSSKYMTFTVPLKQAGGISIRTYYTKAGEVDYEHIHSNNKPVVPASSWNGLFRKSFLDYAKMIFDDGTKANEWVNQLFGYVEGDSKQKSNIYFEESILTDGEEITQAHNVIDRFVGKAKERGLYQERSYYLGKTVLNIRVNVQFKDLELVEEIIKAIVEDLNDGWIALGGQTSIGRGLFEVEGKIEIHHPEKEVEVC